MNKRHVITITGDLASGKSSVSDILKKELNYEVYKPGQYARKLAMEKNMTINDFQAYLKEHPELDQEIETNSSKYAQENDNIIVDARLGWYSIPYSFKIYLKTDIDVSAKRAFNDCKRQNSEPCKDVQTAKEQIQKRYNEEIERFFSLYNIRKDDMSNYDLVIDTSDMKVEEIAEKIKKEYIKWLEN